MSTFLAIANNLLAEFPGMPRPIVKQCIMDAYLEIYRKWQWSPFDRTIPIVMFSNALLTPYASGSNYVPTVSTAASSATVTLSYGDGDNGGSFTSYVGTAPSPAAAGTLLQTDRAYGINFRLTYPNDNDTSTFNGTSLNEIDKGIYTINRITAYGAPSTAAKIYLNKVWAGGSYDFEHTTYGGARYEIFKVRYPIIAPSSAEIVDEILDIFNDDTNLVEVPRTELMRMSVKYDNYGEPRYWAKSGKDNLYRYIDVWPIPDDNYQIYARCRILPTTTWSDTDSPYLDSQLIEAYAWLKICPKVVKILGDKDLQDQMQYKKQYADELFNDCMMDDFRDNSQYNKIRNVATGRSYLDTNEFQVDHDVDW